VTASQDRILTTHVGSLPRPDDLIDLLVAKDRGQDYDPALLERRITESVAETVEKQVACGVDIVSDGEMSKISYTNYLKHRLKGFGAPEPLRFHPADLDDHPGLFSSMRGGQKLPNLDPPACRAPMEAGDRAPLDADLANYQAAVKTTPPVAAFMNAASPGVVAQFMPNAFYPTDHEYVHALGEALQEEYEAIHQAGFILQLDCPDLAMTYHMAYTDRSIEEFRRDAAIGVEALNHATRNIPPEAMRMHICWGNYPGPHTHDIPLKDVADIVFSARPQAVLFEGANPRHGHEYEELAEVDIPQDTILVPGVIDTNTNHVEHPKLVAQRLCAYADLVGRERVQAGTDCGFATLASLPRVWPSVVWEKLKSMTEGAAIATDRLWGMK
jgi:5-methyltetrahydropteroyltriglutamate--homocysteine methyltransferase